MNLTRGSFLKLAILSSGSLFGAPAGAPQPWIEAFRKIGFDPTAPDSDVFVVQTDSHLPHNEPDGNNEVLRAMVHEVNAMRPRAKFMLALGDQLRFNGYYSMIDMAKRAGYADEMNRDVALFKDIYNPLEIPFIHVAGNHDNERLRGIAEYAERFPGWKPYERLNLMGMQFLKLNSGYAGSFDEEQKKWLEAERARLDPTKTLVVVLHHPPTGRSFEADVPTTLFRILGDWKGKFWILAGHHHVDILDHYTLPGGGKVQLIVHNNATRGYYLYGVRKGDLVARLWIQAHDCDMKNAFRQPPHFFKGTWDAPCAKVFPAQVKPPQKLPLPFQNKGIVWSMLFGQNENHSLTRLVVDRRCDTGSWLFFAECEMVFRVPFKQFSKATKLGVLGVLLGLREKKNVEEVWVSSDQKSWQQAPYLKVEQDLYQFALPKDLNSKTDLIVKIKRPTKRSESKVSGLALLCDI